MAHHMLPPGHHSFVDDLGGIVPARIDVDAFFDDRVRSCAQCLPRLVAARLDLRLGHLAVRLLRCHGPHRWISSVGGGWECGSAHGYRIEVQVSEMYTVVLSFFVPCFALLSHLSSHNNNLSHMVGFKRARRLDD